MGAEVQPITAREATILSIINMLEVVTGNQTLGDSLKKEHKANLPAKLAQALYQQGFITADKVIGCKNSLAGNFPSIPRTLQERYDAVAPSVSPAIEPEIPSPIAEESLPPAPTVPEFTFEQNILRYAVIGALLAKPSELEAKVVEAMLTLKMAGDKGQTITPEVIQGMARDPEYWDNDSFTKLLIKGLMAKHPQDPSNQPS